MPSAVAVSSRIRFAYPVAAVAVLAVFAAGCTSSRFDRADVTGATNPAGTEAVYGQPMPPALVGTNPIAGGQATTFEPTNQVATTQLPPAGTAPTLQQQTVVAAIAPTSQSTTITVQPGDTLYSLSRTHGVSVAAIAAANGLTQTSMLDIGQRLVIPAPGTTAALGTPPAPLGVITETQPGPAATTTTAQPATNSGTHIVQTGETLYAISLLYGVSVNSLASANGLVSTDIVRIGQQLTIPGRAGAGQPQIAAVPAVQTEPAAPTPPPNTTPSPAAPPVANDDVVTTPAPETPAIPTDVSIAGTDFRWPAQGRIISDFGPKPSGERNDGINLSVPVGTDIHAAETGVVIYAGNGIAGYGNLVLIEHTDNWVTAYAHLSEMTVDRDAVIQRGQIIGLAGNSGAVTAAQLHFELRRGTTPVNPLDYLTD